MSKETVAAYAICADNKDPWGAGRIRVIIDNDFTTPVRTAVNIQTYLAQLDVNNTNKNGSNAYIPWELGVDNHMPDPYVISPFLPKHLNITPKIGESIKILYYTIGNDAVQREYIGPHTSNYDRLVFDSVESGRVFTSKTTYYPKLNPLRSNGLVPDVEDIGLFGRSNSDLVLPENMAIIRAGHQDFKNKMKNVGAALFQASYYPTRKFTTTETVDVDNTLIKPIDYFVEFDVKIFDKSYYDGKYIETTVNIYKAIGVNTKNYNPYKAYLTSTSDIEFSVIIATNKTGTAISFIKTLLKSLDRSYSIDPVTVPSSNPNLKYTVIDGRVSETGAGIDNTYNLGLYQFRSSINNDSSVTEVAEIVNGLPSGLHPASKVPTKQITQEEQDVIITDPDYDETVIVQGANKLFLLSWNGTQMVQNKIGKYGFSQDEVYLTLQKNTEPMVKGDSLHKLLLDIITLIERHGHSAGVDPIGSINKDAETEIKNIKERYNLLNPVGKDLSGGSSILNQYIRLN